jgi:hypothetical protein
VLGMAQSEIDELFAADVLEESQPLAVAA